MTVINGFFDIIVSSCHGHLSFQVDYNYSISVFKTVQFHNQKQHQVFDDDNFLIWGCGGITTMALEKLNVLKTRKTIRFTWHLDYRNLSRA